MWILGLETAGKHGSVGLMREDEPFADILFPAGKNQGGKLLPAVEALLQLAEAKRDELGLIAVSIGPGSFTGLRIGIATAKGLAKALEIPIVGVSAADAYVRAAGFWAGPVWVLLPDRRGWVYYAAFRGGELIVPLQISALEGLPQRLRDHATREEKVLFVGPGVECHRAMLLERCPEAVLAPVALNEPSGLEIARLGLEKYRATGHDELYELEPLYLQPPLAEMAAHPRSNRLRI